MVWPLHARGLCITYIPSRDFWYYTMWNLNASSGRGAQWSGWKVKDDLASSESDMETCWCRESSLTSEGVWNWVWSSGFAGAVLYTAVLRFFGESLNTEGPAMEKKRKIEWRWEMCRLVKRCTENVSVGGSRNAWRWLSTTVSLWGCLYEAVHWNVTMLLKLLQTVIN